MFLRLLRSPEARSKEHVMNPANLPFDSEAMLQGLRGWVECESPTWDAVAVERMLDIAARDMAIMGASIERIAGRQGFAGCVRARFPHPRQGEPGILIAGHFDTVHPVGTLEKLPFRRDGGKCYGPGIYDMKGGSYLSLETIRQLARASFTTPLPITVLFTPDEEVVVSYADDFVILSRGRAAEALACHGGPHFLRRHRAWRPVGQLRRDHLYGRGTQHGKAAGRSGPRRRAHARAFGRRERRDFHCDARRDAAGVGTERSDHGAL
jgi:acetylornithine deacetylase/succinyl-diaminopimelate desuccinylase-like protein